MQSNLREINIHSFIIFLLKEQKQGILSVEIPSKKNPESELRQFNLKQSEVSPKLSSTKNKFLTKNLFLFGGEITYTSNSHEDRYQRIQDYLVHYQLEFKLDEYLKNSQPSHRNPSAEYDYLIWLLQTKYLNPSQFKAIISQLIEETLLEILIYREGKIRFEVDYRSYSICYGQSTINTICKLNRNLRQWRQLRPYIRSPYQCLHLENRNYLQNNLSPKTYECLISWADNGKSLIQLSRQLNCSLIYVGKALYPYLQQGLLTLKTNYGISQPDDSIL